MHKISVIVPVYNTEKYIEKCLKSILIQKNVELEIIVVNDGSTDNSEKVIQNMVEQNPEQIKYFYKENGGLSDARNYGVNKATGDYICFVDSDDYISEGLLEKIEKYINQGIDLIKYKCIRVNTNYEELERIDGPVFENKTGEEAFNILFPNDVLLEPVWLYLYKKDFWTNGKFQFPINKYHEDWATVPYIVISASSVVATDIYGYCYVQSEDSITRNNNTEKILKRAYDMLEHYDNLLLKLEKNKFQKITIENFKIYMTNCLILKLEEIPKQFHKEYIKELKKRKIAKNIKARNLKQAIKKIILTISVELYLKIK